MRKSYLCGGLLASMALTAGLLLGQSQPAFAEGSAGDEAAIAVSEANANVVGAENDSKQVTTDSNSGASQVLEADVATADSGKVITPAETADELDEKKTSEEPAAPVAEGGISGNEDQVKADLDPSEGVSGAADVAQDENSSDVADDVQDKQDQAADESTEQPVLMLSSQSVAAEESKEESKNGFVIEDGKTYYYENGTKVTGEKYIGGSWYYFNPDNNGEMVTGWSELPAVKGSSETRTVYYDSDGKMHKGQGYISSKWYYFNQNTGAMSKGWQWISDQSKWVFYDRTNGWMLYKEQYLTSSNNLSDTKKYWYYFNDATGAVTYGWKWLSDNSKWVCYADGAGWMLKGEHSLHANAKDTAWHWYYFDQTTGAAAKGWTYLKAGAKWVYYHDTTSWMLYGEQNLHSSSTDTAWHWYYFDDATGATTYGYKWIASGNKTVFYDRGWGWMVYGWQNIDNTWNYFNTSTGAQIVSDNAGRTAWEKVQNLSSSSTYLISIDNANCRTVVFEGSSGNWTPIAEWLCCVGTTSATDASYGKTAQGIFSILRKYERQGNDPDEYYWSTFCNTGDPEGQGIHSILYYRGGGVYDGRLGMKITHGCVRVALENAKWIYYNCPIGTTVYSWE